MNDKTGNGANGARDPMHLLGVRPGLVDGRVLEEILR